MFEITDTAAKQLQVSAEQVGDKSLSLRISARKSNRLGMQYNMGFCRPAENDVVCRIGGINVVVDAESVKNVKNMIVDFREFDGLEQFVFINPNDVKDRCDISSSDCKPNGETTGQSCSGD